MFFGQMLIAECSSFFPRILLFFHTFASTRLCPICDNHFIVEGLVLGLSLDSLSRGLTSNGCHHIFDCSV